MEGGGEKAFFSETEMTVLNKLRRVLAKISGRNYVEDFVRVYPNELVYNEKGESVSYTSEHHSNFLNHCKFYEFASQYLNKGKSVVLDAGCGSGYGTKILKEGGAAEVHAFDLSSHAIEFAHRNFSDFADFRTCGITDLAVYEGKEFDLVTCSEVLEHIKEYGREREALIQLRNVMKPGGMLVLGTPNDEMLPNHGFSFREMEDLLKEVFSQYLILEHALLPPSQRLHLWENRLAAGETGFCVAQEINFDETVCDEAISSEICKPGREAGEFERNGIKVNTQNLHNTHSWVVLAMA